ncbi:glycosyltransferase family 4 protein [Photobacterium leiognathi]|uniref:glycosyltransferase family 4 protein n=1 Tax=Photobacterium leiognathi TaxID=553611 RepID=UPI0029814954|nr:glycosyltransferase family 4 protein [Photobacterium leiognathi]
MKYDNIIIIIDRLLDVNNQEMTIGGIQTYIYNLCELIRREFNTKPYIYQNASTDFTKNFENFIVKGKKTNNYHKCNNLFESVKNDFLGDEKRTLIIWGSDQYSVRQKFFRSISIQHGIGFDTEATETGIRKKLNDFNLISLYKLFQRLRAVDLFERSDEKVCVDYNFLNWYRTFRKTDSKDITVIPNFTEIKDIKRSQNKDKIKIVYARRFVNRRGISIALSLADYILEKYPNCEFYFAGGGDKLSQVEKFVNHNERAFLTSYKYYESVDFHSQFDIALVPSIGSEGTSLSLLEAMSAKCAVIASNVGGMTNIILDGFNGYLVNPDIDSFTQKVEYLLDNNSQLETIQNNAFSSVCSSFSKDKWDESWIKLLKRI